LDDDYFIWADLYPSDVNIEEYIITNLMPSTKGVRRAMSRTVMMQNTVQGYTFKLSFDRGDVVAGTPVVGTIMVTDARENPVKDIEPVMGSFVSVLGFFADDVKTAVYIYAMGEPPLTSYDRAGPELKFYMDPERRGFMKLFVQVKIQGETVVVPFGIDVK